MIRTRSLTLSALLIAAGVAAALILHSVGIGGQVILPLHYPALLAGFLLGWPWGATVGVVTPLLSSLLTGMPPLIPSALLMVPELAVYGAVAGLLRKVISLYPALLAALILGRLAWGLGVWALTPLLGLKIPVFAALAGGVAVGLPGIIGQIVLVPLLVKRIESIRSPSGDYS